MRAGTFILLAVGFGLKTLSGSLELQGDLAVAPGDRLFYHVTALVVLIAAGTCFLRAGWQIWRSFYRKDIAATSELERVFADPAEQFDADAAMRRYMETRAPGDKPPPSPPERPTFGRKGT